MRDGRGPVMGERLDQFFAGLAASAPARLPSAPRGTIQFNFVQDDGPTTTWYVTLRDSRAQVDRVHRDATCVVEMKPDAFERLLAGADNEVAMLLRGSVSVEGDLSLFFAFRRLLPRSADSRSREPSSTVHRYTKRSGFDRRDVTSVFYGNIFMISAENGDVEATPTSPLGLFFFDTRFLSTWRLTVNDERLSVLSIDDIRSFETNFALAPGTPTHYVSATTSILRHRWVAESFEEEITLLNFAPAPARYTVRLDVGADFAEVLEIRDGYCRSRQVSTTIDQNALRLHYVRQSLHRETVISASEPAHIDEDGLTFTVTIDSHSAWSTRVRVLPLVRDLHRRDLRERLTSSTTRPRIEAGRDIDEVSSGAPRLRCDHAPLRDAYHRSILDLAALRYLGLNFKEHLPTVGLPWSMTLLGRENLISSFQALPFLPSRAASTLRILALSQGTRTDPFRGEEPGKILQESWYGESSAFNETPGAAGFFAADTTALFVILLDEYERWTGDATAVREYECHVRDAISWIDGDADLTGTGYVWSACRNTRIGLVNESWRSSPGGICFRDGRLATSPQAMCEIQGYTYDAKLRAARMARQFWADPAYADRLERDAAELRDRFNRDFWLPERGYYALALQADGDRVDALTSSIGHLLWSGIVPPERAESLARHLLGPALYSGWGVRTLASTETQFSPLGYHNGAVWPFDNSLIVWGLRRYGFRKEAARIAHTLLEAGEFFGGRLPALFAGYDRTQTRYPVPHTSADSPYAPSAGATLLLLRALLGLDPYNDYLVVDPAVPEELGYIELLDIPGRWGSADALAKGRRFRRQPR